MHLNQFGVIFLVTVLVGCANNRPPLQDLNHGRGETDNWAQAENMYNLLEIGLVSSLDETSPPVRFESELSMPIEPTSVDIDAENGSIMMNRSVPPGLHLIVLISWNNGTYSLADRESIRMVVAGERIVFLAQPQEINVEFRPSTVSKTIVLANGTSVVTHGLTTSFGVSDYVLATFSTSSSEVNMSALLRGTWSRERLYGA
jgi:hypothetical protein